VGFSIGSTVRFGWDTFKKRPWLFIGAFLLFVIAQGLLDVLSSANEALFPISDEDFLIADALVDFAIHFGLGALISMGLTAFNLAAHDNPGTVKLFALWHPHPYWKFLGLSVLFSIVILAGVLLGFVLVDRFGLENGLAIGIPLLFVLGAIFWLTFMFAGFFVIDREVGPIEAMKESYRITRGHRWSLLGLLLVLLLINLLGALALIVGLLVSAPVLLLAFAHAYRVLAGSAETRPADAALAAV